MNNDYEVHVVETLPSGIIRAKYGAKSKRTVFNACPFCTTNTYISMLVSTGATYSCQDCGRAFKGEDTNIDVEFISAGGKIHMSVKDKHAICGRVFNSVKKVNGIDDEDTICQRCKRALKIMEEEAKQL